MKLNINIKSLDHLKNCHPNLEWGDNSSGGISWGDNSSGGNLWGDNYYYYYLLCFTTVVAGYRWATVKFCIWGDNSSGGNYEEKTMKQAII